MRPLVLAVLLALTVPARAQWSRVETNIPLSGPYVASLSAYDSGSLVSIVLEGPPYRARAFHSADDGSSWTEAGTFGPYSFTPNFLTTLGGRFAAGALPGDGSAAVFVFSDDGGANWTEVIAPGIASPHGMASIGSTYVAVTSNTLARSTDAGLTWSMIPGSPSGYGLAATSQALFLVSTTGSVMRSTDAGTTWETLDVSSPLNLVHGLWTVGDLVYAHVVLGDIVVSADQGATWSNLSTFNQTAFLAVVTSPSGSAWFPFTSGTLSRFWLSTDRGATAVELTEGYPLSLLGAPCMGAPVATDRHLIVTTQCFNTFNGIWRWEYASTGTTVERTEQPDGLDVSSPFPNPVQGSARFAVRSDRTGTATWTVIDILGRTVASGATPVTAGLSQSIDVDFGGAPPGPYFVRLASGTAVETHRVVVAR